MTMLQRQIAEPDSLFRLWFGLFGAPVAWALHIGISYPLVPFVCATGREWVLHAITVVTALIALAAGVLAWRSWRRLRETAQPSDDPPAGRRTFMAFYGMFISGLFFLVTVAEGLPVFFLHPCE